MRDNPRNPQADDRMPAPQRMNPHFTDDRPEAMGCIEFMRSVIDEFDDRVLVGEVQGKIDRIGHFYDAQRPRLHLPLNFALLDSAWDAISLQATLDAYLGVIPEGAWPDWVIGGHDKPRAASKLGTGQARILAMLLMTVRGTPFLFAGDEIGAAQAKIPGKAIRDPFERLLPGYGLNRDPERVPMRWEESGYGGFSGGPPWLPATQTAASVAAQQADRQSLLWLYRRLIELRRTEKAFTEGEMTMMRSVNDVLCYRRAFGGREFVVALNIAAESRRWRCDATGELVMSSRLDTPARCVTNDIILRANEGVVIRLTADASAS